MDGREKTMLLLRNSTASTYRLAILLTVCIAGCKAREPAVCEDLPGSRAGIAATPRSDSNLELLALSLSRGITADQSLYDRVVSDMSAIRKMNASVRHLKYEPAYDGKGLIVSFDNETAPDARAGKYKAWDCLNRHYGVQKIYPLGVSSPETTWIISLKGIYNLDDLAKLYRTLPGITSVYPNHTVSTLDERSGMRVSLDEEKLHYIFFVMADDRRAAVQDRVQKTTYYYFTAAQGHIPELVETVTTEVRMGNAPRWMKKYWYGPEAMRAFGYEAE